MGRKRPPIVNWAFLQVPFMVSNHVVTYYAIVKDKSKNGQR